MSTPAGLLADLHACSVQGDVLEISAGTGRNIPYYRYDQLKSLTLTDSSKYMLWHASQKYRDRQAAKGSSLPVSFFLSNAENLSNPEHAAAVPTSALISPRQPPDVGTPAETPQSGQQSEVSGVFATRTYAYPENSFDTVVDTFGLCSHGNPVQALKVIPWYPVWAIASGSGIECGMFLSLHACLRPTALSEMPNFTASIAL